MFQQFLLENKIKKKSWLHQRLSQCMIFVQSLVLVLLYKWLFQIEAERLNASYSSSGVNEGVCWGCDRCRVPLALLIKNAFCFLRQQIIYAFRLMPHTPTRSYLPPRLWRDALCALHQAWLPAHLSTCLTVLWIQLKSNSLPTLNPLLLFPSFSTQGAVPLW